MLLAFATVQITTNPHFSMNFHSCLHSAEQIFMLGSRLSMHHRSMVREPDHIYWAWVLKLFCWNDRSFQFLDDIFAQTSLNGKPAVPTFRDQSVVFVA